MPDLTDQQSSPAEEPVSLRSLLTTMADLLSHNTPETEFTDGERLTMARELTKGGEPAHTQLLAYTPRIEQPVTRGEYALRLRRAAPIPELHAQAADDYRRSASRRIQRHRDDTHLIQAADETGDA